MYTQYTYIHLYMYIRVCVCVFIKCYVYVIDISRANLEKATCFLTFLTVDRTLSAYKSSRTASYD